MRIFRQLRILMEEQPSADDFFDTIVAIMEHNLGTYWYEHLEETADSQWLEYLQKYAAEVGVTL
tara:strand:- start:288 stop:479 length:192 start_codon:yes stop_codon:yes gene_type:complete